jgi:epoxyqueuosine reductase
LRNRSGEGESAQVNAPEWTAASRTAHLRRAAQSLGFHKVGFAPAGVIDPEQRLRRWLDRGFAGELDYMARTADERADPRRYVEGARSVVALAISYYRPDYTPSAPLKVSRYAVGRDYHHTIKKKVRKLRKELLAIDPGAKVAPTVDTSPVLERAWAERAGIAWIGKSTMAIGRDVGTYTFLATLITTTELEYDAPHLDHCGSCTACLDACPTQAFDGPYRLDATKCITYWNVEQRAPFPDEAPDLHGWVAGCDVCQEVCPWNKFARPNDDRSFAPRPELAKPDPSTFTELARSETLSVILEKTALERTGAEAIRRNALRIVEEKTSSVDQATDLLE